jgi:type II secretion system protein H
VSRRRQHAFTLLEMLAVVLIMGLVAGLVLPGLGFVSGQALDDSGRQLSSDLEFARQRTVMTGVPHRVMLDLDRAAWWVEWQPEPEEEEESLIDEASAPPSGRPPVDISPPSSVGREFVALPTQAGRHHDLQADIVFAGVETADGSVERDRVSVLFERDGTAEPARITLRDQAGYGIVLEVRPLADAVRVFDAD